MTEFSIDSDLARTVEITNELDSDQFDEWLAGASLAHTSVEILQNPGLLGEWEDLQRRYQRAQQIAKGEGGIADDNPLADLEAEAEQLLGRIEASRTTFHLRALTPDDLAAILAAHPILPAPKFAGRIPSVQPNPTETQAKAFLGMYAAYEAQMNRWQDEHADEIDAHRKATMDALQAQGAEKVVRALVRIEQGGRVVAERLTVAQVIQLEQRIGQAQMKLILSKIDDVSEAVPEVPASFLSHSSGSDQN